MNAKTRDNLESHKVMPTPEQTTESPAWKDPKRYMWLLGPALPGVEVVHLWGLASRRFTEDDVMDAESLPLVEMPHRDDYEVPEPWTPDTRRGFEILPAR